MDTQDIMLVVGGFFFVIFLSIVLTLLNPSTWENLRDSKWITKQKNKEERAKTIVEMRLTEAGTDD